MLARSILVRAPVAGSVLAKNGSAVAGLQQIPRTLTAGIAHQINAKSAWNRSFAVSAVSGNADAGLVGVLKEEITYEKENNSKSVVRARHSHHLN